MSMNAAGISSADLINSVALIKSAKAGEPVSAAEITERTRLNEQELYGALVHQGLGEQKGSLAAAFEEKLKSELPKQKKSDSENYFLCTVRKVLRGLKAAGQLTVNAFREIRRNALGLAQLDSDRTRLSVARRSDKADDTPLRSLKTVLDKLGKNGPASDAELKAFVANNRKEVGPALR